MMDLDLMDIVCAELVLEDLGGIEIIYEVILDH